MEVDFLSTLFNPGVMFFILGFLAVMLGSNLEIPESVVTFLSLYLMMAIGFKGGVSLYTSPLGETGLAAVGIVLAMSTLVPIYVYVVMRRSEGDYDAAALGGVYGSNSTLTYITAAAFLTSIGVSYGGYMTVALVIMETPAVILAIMIARWNHPSLTSRSHVFKKALTDGTLLLLLGSMLVGYLLMLMGNDTSLLTTFISGDMFSGMLIFFLLYMGTLVGKKIKELESFNLRLVAFSVIVPLVNGLLALWLAVLFTIPQGSALLLIILCASSSYIVAPAIIKDALPEANPAKYLTMSMGITFPFNIVIGIPMYWYLVKTLLPAQ
jgi:hypothetical protein